MTCAVGLEIWYLETHKSEIYVAFSQRDRVNSEVIQDCMRASVSFIFVHLPFTHASVRARSIRCHLGVIPICFFYPMGGVPWICSVLMTCACRLWVRSASKQLSTSTLHDFRRSSNELACAMAPEHIFSDQYR